jgi:DNA-binding transcriptional ArsR family regulator
LTAGRGGSIFNHVVNSSLDATFAALADPTRRAILARLSEGDRNVGELAAPFDVSLPAITKHLNVLERAGLLVREKEGRVRRCQLLAAPLQGASEWIERYRRFWEVQLDSLARYLEKAHPGTEPKSKEGKPWHKPSKRKSPKPR